MFTKEQKKALEQIDDKYEEDGFNTSNVMSKDDFNPAA